MPFIKFDIEERGDGWYAIFPNGEEFGPRETKIELMEEIVKDSFTKFLEILSENFPCPRCGKKFAGATGFLLEIEGAPVLFCSDKCAYKRCVFPRNFQKELI
jgi:hypothetical protein